MSTIVLLDTNFLLIPGQFGVDIFQEISTLCHFKYELAIMDRTLQELGRLSQQKGKDGAAARIALQLVQQKAILQITAEKTVDTAILEQSQQHWIVATQDKALKKKLQEKKIRIITLRNKSRVQLE